MVPVGEETVLASDPGLRPRLVVTGRVIDEQGRPIPGAHVWGPEGMRIHQYHSWLWQVTTDEAGEFRVEREAHAWREEYKDWLCSSVGCKGFVRTQVAGRPGDWDAVENGGSIEGLVVVLRRAMDVEFRVLDEEGRPLPGVRVATGVKPEDPSVEGPVPILESDARGAGWWTGVDPEWPRWFRAEGLGCVSEAVTPRMPEDGSSTARIDLVLRGLEIGRLRVVPSGATKGAMLFVDGELESHPRPPDDDEGWLISVLAGGRFVEVKDAADSAVFRDTVLVPEGEEVRIELDVL